MIDDILTPEVKANIRARAKSYRVKQAQEKEALVIDIDRARKELDELKALLSAARRAIDGAEQNAIELTAAAQRREKALEDCVIELFYWATLGMTEGEANHSARRVPEHLRERALSEWKGFREKHESWR